MTPLRHFPWIAPLWLGILVSCGGGGGGDANGQVGQRDAGPGVPISLQRVFSTVTLDDPVAMLQAPGDATRWFVVEQGGTVKVFNASGMPSTAIFADIRNRVSSGGETGLLGMAFHPDFPNTELVYLSYTNNSSGLVSRVSEFPLSGGTVDEGSERILMTVAQPQTNHNGGGIAFGPDGFLYIGFGDGGGADDQNHGLIGNGQSLTPLLGKMLRIDVSGTTAGGFN